jgi:hypothetical protein
LKYKKSLDTRIINYLIKNEKESRNRLKEIVGEKSDDVFDHHTTKLITDGILSRTKKIQGKKTFYFLTVNGKKEYGLKLLRDENENSIYKNIYQELLLSEFNNLLIFIYNEDDFNKFLQDCNISQNLLEWGELGNARDEYRRIIYPNFYDRRTRREDYIHLVKEFWSKREGQSFSLEDIDFICKPLKIFGETIWIFKTEHWQINKKGIHTMYAISYSIKLPGIEYEHLKNLLFYKYYGNVTIDVQQIDDAIKLAKQYKLIKINKFGRYKQIIILDKKLRELLEAVQNIHYFEFNLIFNKWLHFETPSSKEDIMMKKLLGINESRQMFLYCELIRARERSLLSKCKNLNQYIEQLKHSYSIYENSKIIDDPHMTKAEKKLYKNMKIIPIIDNTFEIFLISEYQDYINNEIPRKKRAIQKEINEFKKQLADPFRHDMVKSSINTKIKKLNRLRNYEKHVKDFVIYRKEIWECSKSKVDSDIKIVKAMFKDVYYKYEFILKHIFQFLLPSFIEFDPDPDYTKENFLKLKKEYNI